LEHLFHTNGLFVRIFGLVHFSLHLLWLHLTGILFRICFSQFFFAAIWREFVSDPFQSAFIDAASGGKLVFGSF
jgi:hypothetical protein